mgnify:CR=1 FL=1
MMASKSKRLRQNTELRNKTINRIGYLSVFVFLVKIFIIWRIPNLTISQAQGHIWLGADGENYLKGTDGLISEGILSKEGFLSYWPAGYPLIIYFLSFFGKSWTLTVLALVQSLFFSISIYFLANEIYKSRLKKYVVIIFIFLIFNPTLSLSSISVGYESFCASGFIAIMTLILKDLRISNKNQSIKTLIFLSIISSLLSFMQPRFLLAAIFILIIWTFSRFKGTLKKTLLVLTVSLIISVIFPLSLIIRNHFATGFNGISTNLGVTMSIGAGDTNGSYNGKHSLPCRITETENSKIDNQRVKCVINWYLKNPIPALKLFYNKSLYFWSPWFGPEANGTMARNPWLTIHPLKNMTQTQDGINLLYGTFGKLVSWIWMLSGLVLVFYGFLILWRQKDEIKLLAIVAGAIVFSSWLVTLITIGDHRFRLPIMGASLLLQAVAIRRLFAGGKPPMVQPPSLR